MNRNQEMCFDSCNAICLEQTLWIHWSLASPHMTKNLTLPNSLEWLSHTGSTGVKGLLGTFSIPFIWHLSCDCEPLPQAITLLHFAAHPPCPSSTWKWCSILARLIAAQEVKYSSNELTSLVNLIRLHGKSVNRSRNHDNTIRGLWTQHCIICFWLSLLTMQGRRNFPTGHFTFSLFKLFQVRRKFTTGTSFFPPCQLASRITCWISTWQDKLPATPTQG